MFYSKLLLLHFYILEPQSIQNLRIRSVTTDEKYTSIIELAFDWPKNHNFNFHHVAISWAVGKANLQFYLIKLTLN